MGITRTLLAQQRRYYFACQGEVQQQQRREFYIKSFNTANGLAILFMKKFLTLAAYICYIHSLATSPFIRLKVAFSREGNR